MQLITVSTISCQRLLLKKYSFRKRVITHSGWLLANIQVFLHNSDNSPPPPLQFLTSLAISVLVSDICSCKRLINFLDKFSKGTVTTAYVHENVFLFLTDMFDFRNLYAVSSFLSEGSFQEN